MKRVVLASLLGISMVLCICKSFLRGKHPDSLFSKSIFDQKGDNEDSSMSVITKAPYTDRAEEVETGVTVPRRLKSTKDQESENGWFVLNEPCLAVIGETMLLTEVTNSTNLLPEDIPRPALESEDSETQDVWLSCVTPSGMIFDIDGADHEWMVEVLQKKKLESGDTFLITPDKCRVGAVDQKLLVPKSALKFAKAPKSEKSDKSDSKKSESKKSDKSDSKKSESKKLDKSESEKFSGSDKHAHRRKLKKGSSKTSRRGLGRTSSAGITNGIEKVLEDCFTRNAQYWLNKVTQELNYQFGVTNQRELADHVMYCFPPGNRWCTYVSAQMHEIGHNLGWGHSGTMESKYNDRSGIMGFSYARRDGPKICTNGAKFWKTSWYGDRYHIINDVSLDQELRSLKYTGGLTSFNNDPLVTGPPMIIKVATDTNMTYFVGYNGMTENNSGAKSLGTVNVYSVEDEEMYGSSSILHATLSAGESFHASIGLSLNVTVFSIGEASGEAFIDIDSTTTITTSGSFEVLVDGTCDVTHVEESLLSSLKEIDPESTFEIMSAQPHCVSRRNLQEATIAAEDYVLATMKFRYKHNYGQSQRARRSREIIDGYKERKNDIDARVKSKYRGAGKARLRSISYFHRATSAPSIKVSDAPSSSPTRSGNCLDSPEGWHDADGEMYNCDWYGVGDRCTTWGASSNFNTTANEACCSCGGGRILDTSLSLSSTSSPSNIPSHQISLNPSKIPSHIPSIKPSSGPTSRPTATPSSKPSFASSLSPTRIASSSPSIPLSNRQFNVGSVCNNKMEGWFDVDGGAYTCDWYSQNGGCQQYGHGSANFGLTANECCCSCGGGDIVSSGSNQGSPSPPSTFQGSSPSSSSGSGPTPGSVCNDKMEGWFDVDGGAYTCEWYSQNGRCQQYGHGSANFGLTANEACCSCGGGDIVSSGSNQGSPSGSPPSTFQGSSQSSSSGSGSTPGSVCNDKMEGWFDVDGGAYTCEWYSQNGRCQQYGHGSANFGLTANECCCSCGGGDIVTSVSNQDLQSPPLLSQGSSPSSSSGSGSTSESVCNDKMEGWFDVDGGAYTCEWYSHSGRCQQYGHGSANFGLTANECCCSCGGGLTLSS
ncbi:hypothetical protein CTEN210_00126 [Chaetoceros tenuissimus]|uniref:Metalloendopeptidase n=1 Tax=Chaetoceros tenuissimus TaxID=426638 RepID=A0AAD3GYN8_9STRA|nr:hypothetical protein CTEN210_00126 [Chaetoceros tenuissimus]